MSDYDPADDLAGIGDTHLPDQTETPGPALAGPDPADHALLPHDAETISSIMGHPDLAAMPPAERWRKADPIISAHRQRHGAQLVELPDSNPQLGYRWTKLLTGDQFAQARERGCFRYLLAGLDPDGVLNADQPTGHTGTGHDETRHQATP